MEKTYQLDQKELNALAVIDQEKTQALAMIGGLSLDMEQARKNLELAIERQKSIVRQALSARGVERYENARAQNGTLFVTGAAEDIPRGANWPTISVDRPNGALVEPKE